MIKKTILDNGLKVITVPQESTQAVTVLILIGTGSKYETREINGISHFLEHMMFNGTEKRPTLVELVETLDKVGGIYNAFTGQEYTGYYAKVEASKFELAFDWVSDIFLNAKVLGEKIEKEKGVINEEINMIFDHPMSYIGEVMWPKLLYADQPAGWDIAGTKESVNSINREELLNYREKQYVASNTIVCVAGKFQEEKALEMVKETFSKMGKGNPIEKPKVFEVQESPQYLIETRKTDQTHLRLGVRSFNLFHPDRYIQEILGTILGGMMSSRLFLIIREKLGLAYYIRTEVEANPDTGFLVTSAGVDNKKAEKAVLAIMDEYKRVKEEKVPESELQKAKDNLRGRLALLLESSDSKASFYSLQELLEKETATPEMIFKRIDKISVNDILRVAGEIFKPENLNLALIGPIENKENFEKILKF